MFDTYLTGKTVLLAGGAPVAQSGGMNGASKTVRRVDQVARGLPSGPRGDAPDAGALARPSLEEWLMQQHVNSDEEFSFGTATRPSSGVPPANLSLLRYLSVIHSANSSVQQLESMKGGAQEWRFAGGSQVVSIKMAQALGDNVRRSSPVRKISGWNREVV